MKIIMIDGFRYGYLDYAPYLKSLTKKYQHGSIETPLGFWGSMQVFFKGNSDTLAFFYHSEKSSFKYIRYFSFLGKFIVNCLINIKRLVRGEVLFSVHNIPLKKVHLFDTDVKRPYHKGFNYEHILDIDKTAHKYGTNSEETKNCIRTIDKKLMNKEFDIILSDHGMMDIKELISVPETKKCFIDSTMARYWGEIPENLPLNKGKIIKNKKYGDVIFLANPGILIFPNYWQTSPIKAMHGYNPKIKEMKAFYILKKEGKRKDLTMKELHKLVTNTS